MNVYSFSLKNWNLKQTMMRFKFALLLAAFNLVMTYIARGMFWEASMNSIAQITFGHITSPPYHFWFSETLLFQAPLLAYLCNVFSDFPILGIYLLFIRLLWISILIHLLIRIFNRIHLSQYLTLLLAQVSVLAVIGSSLVYIHVDRESVFLVAFSTLLYLDLYKFENKKVVSLIFLCVLGSMIRVYTGLVALTIITWFAILLFRNIKQTYNALKTQWILLLLLASIITTQKIVSTNPSTKIEHYYEYALMDRHAIMPISTMTNKLDSVKYKALTYYFLVSDSSQINIAFIDRLVDKNQFTWHLYSKSDIAHLKNVLNDLSPINLKLFLFLNAILFIATIYCGNKTKTNILLLNSFGYAILLIIATRLNLYERVLQPLISLYIISSFLLALYEDNIISKLWQKSSVAILVLLLLIAIAENHKEIAIVENNHNKESLRFLNKLALVTKECTPILWDPAIDYIPTDLLLVKETQVLKDAPFMNNNILAYYDFSQGMFIKKFGVSPLDWKKMAETFKARHNDVCFIVNEDLASFLELYYKEIHNIDFKLEKANPVNEVFPDNFVYTLATKNN